MSKKLGIQAAVRVARANAAALVEAMDLEQLYGGDSIVSEQDEEILEYAQQKVVELIRSGVERV